MNIVFVCVEFLSASHTLCVCIEKTLLGFIYTKSEHFLFQCYYKSKRENSQHQWKCEPNIERIKEKKQNKKTTSRPTTFSGLPIRKVLWQRSFTRILCLFPHFAVILLVPLENWFLFVCLFVCMDATVWQRKTAIFKRFHSLRIHI